jgi:hypothetical protein
MLLRHFSGTQDRFICIAADLNIFSEFRSAVVVVRVCH